MDPRSIAIGISVVTFLANIIVLFVLLRRGKASQATVLWSTLVALLALWSFAEVSVRGAGDIIEALAWFRLVLIAGSLVPPIILHFSLVYPTVHRVLRNRWYFSLFLVLVYLINILLLARALFYSLTVNDVPETNTIWGEMYTRDTLTQAVAGDVWQVHYIYLAALLLASIIVVYLRMRAARSRIETAQLRMVFQALSIVFIPAVVMDMSLSILYGIQTDLFSFEMSIIAIITVYSILKYRFLEISPSEEEVERPAEALTMKPGLGYIIPNGAFPDGKRMLSTALSEKRKGLVITNEPPEKVRMELNLKRTPIVHVSEEGNERFRIDPEDLDGLLGTLATFAGMTEKPVLVVYFNNDLLVDMVRRSPKDRGMGGDGDDPFSRLWAGKEHIYDFVSQADRMLAAGTSMLVISGLEGKDYIITRWPIQHIPVFNFFLVQFIVKTAISEIEKAQEDVNPFISELQSSNGHFINACYSDGVFHLVPEQMKDFDRETTITTIRALRITLRKGGDGARKALGKVTGILSLVDLDVREVDRPEGAVHFFVGEDHTEAFEFVRTLIGTGQYCLCFSTRPPDKVKDVYSLRGAQYKWISTTSSKDDETIPVSLEHIRRDIRKFLKGHARSAILLDGIELLISRLGFEDVQRFLHFIKDELAMTQARLVIPINPLVLEKDKLALLKREIEI